MVTSTESGLAVPDWPLSYGTFFPPMVGGVFYEHGHRMVAAFVGFLTLCLALWLGAAEKRRWVRNLGFLALLTVIVQGVLGGITVLFFLPTPVSVSHAVLAQTFFILTILIAYSQSHEYQTGDFKKTPHPNILKLALFFSVLVYLQLILGALMRHTGSGLAIPDFPKSGGYWIPLFNEEMLSNINRWRFDFDLGPVTWTQVIIHFVHRLGAFVITLLLFCLNGVCIKYYKKNRLILSTLICLNVLIMTQLFLGISTVLTQKSAWITSFHVLFGAAVLGTSFLLFLRLAPPSFQDVKRILGSR